MDGESHKEKTTPQNLKVDNKDKDSYYVTEDDDSRMSFDLVALHWTYEKWMKRYKAKQK